MRFILPRRNLFCVYIALLVVLIPAIGIAASFEELQSNPTKFVDQGTSFFSAGYVLSEVTYRSGQDGKPTNVELRVLVILVQSENQGGFKNIIFVVVNTATPPTQDFVGKKIDVRGVVQCVEKNDPKHEVLYWDLLNIKRQFVDPSEEPQTIYYLSAKKITLAK